MIQETTEYSALTSHRVSKTSCGFIKYILLTYIHFSLSSVIKRHFSAGKEGVGKDQKCCFPYDPPCLKQVSYEVPWTISWQILWRSVQDMYWSETGPLWKSVSYLLCVRQGRHYGLSLFACDRRAFFFSYRQNIESISQNIVPQVSFSLRNRLEVGNALVTAAAHQIPLTSGVMDRRGIALASTRGPDLLPQTPTRASVSRNE